MEKNKYYNGTVENYYLKLRDILNEKPEEVNDRGALSSALSEVESQLHRIFLYERYKIDVPDRITPNKTWFTLGDGRAIGRYGAKFNRTIPGLADGRQPDDEMLYAIRFHRGPYILGEDYPTALFAEFFAELKALGPKYSNDRGLYFSMDAAATVHAEYEAIVQRYRDRYKGEATLRRIDRLRTELEQMEARP